MLHADIKINKEVQLAARQAVEILNARLAEKVEQEKAAGFPSFDASQKAILDQEAQRMYTRRLQWTDYTAPDDEYVSNAFFCKYSYLDLVVDTEQVLLDYKKFYWKQHEPTHFQSMLHNAYISQKMEQFAKKSSSEQTRNDSDSCATPNNDLRKFFFTFDSSLSFPYQNTYVIVMADTEKNAVEKFRSKFPDKHKGLVNCAFWYSEDLWHNPQSESVYGKPAEIIL